MATIQIQDTGEALGKIFGLIITAALLLCLRAWLLSLCVALVIPGFVLPFWQWALIAFTARFFLAGSVKDD